MDGSQKARGVRTQRTTLETTERHGGASRWRSPLVAVVTMLALIFSVLVPSGAASAASNLPELVWSQSSSTKATAPLPGNFSSLPGATVTVSSSKQPIGLADSNRTVATQSTVSTSTASCVAGKSRYQINTCDTFTYTVTFGQPVVDPVVPFALLSSTYYSVTEATSKGCIVGWNDATLSSINGRTATADDFSTLAEPTGAYQHSSPTSWTVSQTTINGNACSPLSGGANGTLQLNGAIQSFSFTLYQRNAIVIPWTSTFCPLMAAPAAFGARVLVPVTDLAVQKTAPATADPNGTITWNIAVTNVGSMNSHGFVVKDAVPANVTNAQIASGPAGCTLSGRDLVCAVAPPGCSVTQDPSASTVADINCADSTAAHQTVLAPGQTSTPIVLTATAPVAVGTTIANTATVSGVDVDSNTSNNTSSTVTTVVQSAKLTIAKQAALAPGATGKAGDTVNYSFTATNTGNVGLTGVTIADPLPGLSSLSYAWPGAAGVLQPGQSVTATATYRLTQADVDAGAVSNVATATGKAPDNSTVDGGRAPATVTLNPKPALTVTKNGVLAPGATGVAGDQITYSFSATNTGGVTLSGVTIADRLTGMSGIQYTWPGAASVLAPGQTASATATYTITTADVEAGSVSNVAIAKGRTPSGEDVTAPEAHATLPLPPVDHDPIGEPGISISKAGSLAPGSLGQVGDQVLFTFVVTNTGAVALNSVSISDPLPGVGPIAFGQWPGEAGHLEPGQSITATATYVLTAEDVARGAVENTAWAHGNGGGKDVDGGSNTVSVPIPKLVAWSEQPDLGQTLARTGQDALPIGLGALGLLLLGGLVLALRRRPQES